MAAAYIQSQSTLDNVTGTSSSHTPVSNLTNGSLLYMVVFWTSGTATCSISDDVNGAWTAVGSPSVGSGALAGISAQAFYVNNTSTAKPTITITISSSVTQRGLAFHEYTGVSVLESHSEALRTGTTSPAAPSLTPSTSTGLVLEWIVCGGSESAISTGFTIREKDNFGFNGTADDTSATSGTPLAPTWTCTNSTNLLGALVFDASGTMDTVSPTGTVTLSGSDRVSITTPAGTGTITFTGTKTSALSSAKVLSGSLTLSGSVSVLLKKTVSPSGTLLLAGSVSATQTPGGTTLNVGGVPGTIFLTGSIDTKFKSHGWGLLDGHSPVSRIERNAAGASPVTDVLVNSDDELAWGARTSTEPQSRTASRAAGGEATSITEPDEALVWAWRKKNDQTP